MQLLQYVHNQPKTPLGGHHVDESQQLTTAYYSARTAG